MARSKDQSMDNTYVKLLRPANFARSRVQKERWCTKVHRGTDIGPVLAANGTRLTRYRIALVGLPVDLPLNQHGQN